MLGLFTSLNLAVAHVKVLKRSSKQIGCLKHAFTRLEAKKGIGQSSDTLTQRAASKAFPGKQGGDYLWSSVSGVQ